MSGSVSSFHPLPHLLLIFVRARHPRHVSSRSLGLWIAHPLPMMQSQARSWSHPQHLLQSQKTITPHANHTQSAQASVRALARILVLVYGTCGLSHKPALICTLLRTQDQLCQRKQGGP